MDWQTRSHSHHARCTRERQRTHGGNVSLDLTRSFRFDGRLGHYIKPRQCGEHTCPGEVLDAVQRFCRTTRAVHRGTGFKSRLSTAAYEEAHATIARFLAPIHRQPLSSSGRTPLKRSTSSRSGTHWSHTTSCFPR